MWQNARRDLSVLPEEADAKALFNLYRTARPAYLGVTPPISTDPPSERHKQMTESLMAELKAQNQFESAEDGRLRWV